MGVELTIQKIQKGWVTSMNKIETTIEEDKNRIEEFRSAMFKKMKKGREEHGSEISIDPFLEGMNECLDLALYSMMIYFRLKLLSDKYKKLK